MKNRRKVLIAIAGGLAAPVLSFAQQRAAKVPRIAYLDPARSDSRTNGHVRALLASLRDMGYVEGRNIIFEYRWAEGSYERLPRLAAELVQMKVDVIVAATPVAVRAAKQATSTIPIVMIRVGDPAGTGLVASLARPGGNITGLSNMNIDVVSKHVELLRVALPKLARVTVLVNPTDSNQAIYLKRVQQIEKTYGVKISPTEAGSDNEVENVVGAMKQDTAGALIVLPDALFYTAAPRIAQLAAQRRLPTMFFTREPVESGGLMSYGQNVSEQYHRAATFIDKILKGAKPGDLPVEQPTKVELVINLKTAKAIGLTIPQQLLLQADKVIE